MENDLDLVKMSPKGQLVVPQGIREHEGFKSGDRFLPMEVPDGVLFKRVEMPDLKKRFEALTKQLQRHFREKGIKKSDIDDAVAWARKR